jgi:hypothetical protein
VNAKKTYFISGYFFIGPNANYPNEVRYVLYDKCKKEFEFNTATYSRRIPLTFMKENHPSYIEYFKNFESIDSNEDSNENSNENSNESYVICSEKSKPKTEVNPDDTIEVNPDPPINNNTEVKPTRTDPRKDPSVNGEYLSVEELTGGAKRAKTKRRKSKLRKTKRSRKTRRTRKSRKH